MTTVATRQGDGAPTVLIVDNAALQRRSLATVVQAVGLQAIEAGDAAAALSLAEAIAFDAIITDIEMAPINGFAFIARLTRLYAGKPPPIIVCSVLTGSRSFEKLAEAETNIFAVLQKPIVAAPVLAAVRKALERGNASAGS